MVRIRLSRGGAKARPFYHVVVTDQRNKRDGRNLERLGYYNPVCSGAEKRLVLDVERVNAWVAKGAQMSDKVRALVKEAGKQPVDQAPAVETPVAEAAEAAATDQSGEQASA